MPGARRSGVTMTDQLQSGSRIDELLYKLMMYWHIMVRAGRIVRRGVYHARRGLCCCGDPRPTVNLIAETL